MMRSKHLIWIAALVIAAAALLVFLRLNRPGIREERILVPLEIVNVPPGLVLLELSTRDIDIHLSDPTGGNAQGDLPASYTIDLAEAAEGVSTLSIDKDAFQLPSRIELLSVDPRFVRIKLDKEIARQLPVSAVTSGTVAPEFRISEMVVSPATVVIRGPQSLVAPLKHIPTKPIEVGDLQETIKKETSLELPVPVKTDLDPAIVLVDIFIEEQRVNRRYEKIAVGSKGSPLQISISPATITLEISGPGKILDRLEKEGRIEAYVDCTGLKPGVFARPAIVPLPRNTALKKAHPEIFTVTLSVLNPSGG